MTITGGLLLSSSFNVFAIEASANNVTTQAPKKNCGETHHKKSHKFDVERWVKEGIISQEQADRWKAFNDKHEKEKKKEKKKVKNMTESERKAYFEKRRSEKKGHFDELVNEGIITEEQADQIKEKIIQRHKSKDKESR